MTRRRLAAETLNKKAARCGVRRLPFASQMLTVTVTMAVTSRDSDPLACSALQPFQGPEPARVPCASGEPLRLPRPHSQEPKQGARAPVPPRLMRVT